MRLDERRTDGAGRALIDAVLDASVVLRWFHTEGQGHSHAARSLRASFEAGELAVLAPPLLPLEIINVAGRRWRWQQPALVELAADLRELGFELLEPPLDRVARWTGQGLTAYDAAYVALAEVEAVSLVTDDRLILSAAQPIAIPLAGASARLNLPTL